MATSPRLVVWRPVKPAVQRVVVIKVVVVAAVTVVVAAAAAVEEELRAVRVIRIGSVSPCVGKGRRDPGELSLIHI